MRWASEYPFSWLKTPQRQERHGRAVVSIAFLKRSVRFALVGDSVGQSGSEFRFVRLARDFSNLVQVKVLGLG